MSSRPSVQSSPASAKCSRIFLSPPNCPIPLDGTAPSGNIVWFNEQVTRIEVRPMIGHRQYCHDKSECCMDECDGAHSWNGTIQTKVQCCNTPLSITAGSLCYLTVYPLGKEYESAVISGYAKITEDPIIMNIETPENGIEHNYTYVSKGKWILPATLSGYLECCTCCESSAMGEDPRTMEGSVFAEDFSAKLDNAPVTVYKWTAKDEWVVALDECSGEYMPGPMPQDKPKDENDTLRIVHGIMAV